MTYGAYFLGDRNRWLSETALRRILRIHWPETISNQQLLDRCNLDNIDTIIRRRWWRWIGHVLRKEQDSITRTALHWTPEGRRRRGRPKITWRRTVEKEMKDLGQTWGTVQRLAQSRQDWQSFVAALHASGHNGHWLIDCMRYAMFMMLYHVIFIIFHFSFHYHIMFLHYFFSIFQLAIFFPCFIFL